MFFEDLSPYPSHAPDVRLVSVGWLERGRTYPTGHVDRRVYDSLVAMRTNPWQPFVIPGVHECGLCRFEGEARGVLNLFVPAAGRMYVCPELIVHYMNAHGYAPPAVFCEAVLACPPMRSMTYLRAIAACGGTRLLRPPDV